METQQKPVDKSKWGVGPWQSEPDRVEFEHAGLPCLMTRGPGGHWCGYAAVPPSHPMHGKPYDDCDVRAHGGLTYSDKCRGHVCHVPKPGEPDDVWWFGFDCGHASDHSPSYGNRFRDTPYDHAAALAANDWHVDTYRDVEYVRAETQRLAEQLAAITGDAQ